MKIRVTVVMAAVAMAALSSAASASASVEFGSNCVANTSISAAATITALQSPEGLPIAAPSSGVITQVTSHFDETLPVALPVSIKVLRPVAGSSGQFTVAAEETVSLPPGSLTASTRLPVQAGDHIGMSGEPFSYEGSPIPAFSLYCEEVPGAALGGAEGNLGTGQTGTFESLPEALVPLVAKIEPDADGDGFGDETQDKCPQSATTQAPCPTVVLNTSANVKGAFATVVVTSSIQASVTVSGRVKLGKGKSAKLNGGTQVVAPGTLAKFTIPFTGKLKSALKKLSRKQKLKLKLSATAPNVVGAPTVSSQTAKVKGQAKPKPKKS